jgi:hypothetical protein
MLGYIERYMGRNVIAPMFDMRVKFGDDVFRDSISYLEHGREFPLPPMMVVNGRYRNQSDTDPNFPKWWSRYVMLGEVVEQILSGQSPIRCPRAYAAQLAPGLASFDLMHPPGKGCDQAIKRRSCMTWGPGRQSPLPNCHFNDLTMATRLRPFHETSQT